MTEPFTHTQTVRFLDRFQSGGKEIRVETFKEKADQTVPSIILLHGATGIEYANRFIVTLAQAIALHGFTVHLVHYFDRTGETYANDETIRRSSNDWLKAVDDAVTLLHLRRPTAKIGVFGYSLGGYLAAAAAVRNPNVGAAVVLAGGIDPNSASIAWQAPPILILHGSADTRVPMTEAHNLEEILKRLGGQPEIHIYQAEGHILRGPSYADIVVRSAEFFTLHLNRPNR